MVLDPIGVANIFMSPIGVSLAYSSYSLSQTRTFGYSVSGFSSFHLRITVSIVQVLRFVRYRLYFLTKINQMVKSLLTVKWLIIIH